MNLKTPSTANHRKLFSCPISPFHRVLTLEVHLIDTVVYLVQMNCFFARFWILMAGIMIFVSMESAWIFLKKSTENLTASVAGQMRKDKEDFSLQSESRVDFRHEKSRFLSIFNIQTSGDDLACTFRGDARFKNLSWNSSGCGFSLTSLGKMYSAGAKLEDSISIGRRVKVIANMGRIVGNSQAAYGGALEATIVGRDYPVRDEKMTVAMTFISFGEDAVLGGSLQTGFRIGRSTNASLNANMNNRRLGQILFKTSTSEHVELWLVITAVSLIRAMFNRRTNNREREKS
ncbi:hypothetical protein KSP40_PGU010214 [Platanthera guangdongensis]|uniref:Translocase of chloroplast 159/132 membrane anchor domain-containing protein n=1 Tax=Platanthera guangdongensis TaxID=2320717 RepID=A0ABR2MGW8_9ASPA